MCIRLKIRPWALQYHLKTKLYWFLYTHQKVKLKKNQSKKKYLILDCQTNYCLNGGVLVSRPAATLDQVCICNKNFVGPRCERRLDSLTVEEKQKYGCELRPCWIGSTCEDRDGSFICHCSAVNIQFK